MKINLVIMDGTLDAETNKPIDPTVEVQLPEGDTLVTGGIEVAKLFKQYKPTGSGHGEHGWRFIPYDLDPWTAPGVLGVALQREARRVRAA